MLFFYQPDVLTATGTLHILFDIPDLGPSYITVYMTLESRDSPLLDNGSVNTDSRCNGYAGEGQSVATD
jgi:hypothetical protein